MIKFLKNLLCIFSSPYRPSDREHIRVSEDPFSTYEGGPPPAGMTVCPYCAILVQLPRQMCSHHEYGEDNGWGKGNAIHCNFFHRKKEPVRLPPHIRNEGWANFAEGLREEVEHTFDLLPNN